MQTGDIMIGLNSGDDYRDSEPLEDEVVQAVRRELDLDPVFRGRSDQIRVDNQDGELTLRGRLPSYYLKSVLQTKLRDIAGINKIDNQVQVFYPS